MMATKLSFCLSIFVAVCLSHTTESRCIDVPVEYCRRLGFTGTYFPNHFYHRSISEAVAAFDQYIAADGECSDDFGKFVCAAYFPGCTLANNIRVDIRFNPCRKLCNSAFKPCKLSFRRLGIRWPPELKCGTFPTKECTSVMDELVPFIPTAAAPTPSEPSCEPISSTTCQNLGYDKTIMPNKFGMTTQEAAEADVDKFKPLIEVQCSEALQSYLCASYFPPCSDNIAEMPCRSLCEAAKDGCVQIMRNFGFDWPEHLGCSNLPNDTCFDGGFSVTNGSAAVEPSSNSTMPTQVESQCEPLTIPLCQDLGYTSTMMPNILGHSNQQDAQLQLQTFSPLIQQCSPELKPFLCAVYAPICFESTSQMPCRSLCEAAKDGCVQMMRSFGFDWPEHLGCSNLPNDTCFDGVLEPSSNSTMPTQVESQCEPLTIPLCQDLGYTSTIMPNILGHSIQQDAQLSLETFTPLIQYQCSPALKPFLCAVYAPNCYESTPQIPCRPFCEAARDGCLQTLQTFGFSWPESLNCSHLPNENCYDAGFTIEVKILDSDTAPTMPTQVESQCEPLTIPLCQALGYTSTMMPNMLGHNTQDAAGLEVNQFYPLVRVQCSPALQPFLCALYAPNCSAESLPQMPCRSLCEMARDDCSSLMSTYGFAWPEDFDCTFLPNENCYDAGLTMEVKIPDEGETVGSCEEISLPMCVNISYSQTRLPNVLGHTSQYEAMMALLDNAILIGSECSTAMIPFACSVYAPMCTADGSAKPCRNLCEQAMYECQLFLTIFNMKWPEELKCSQFTNEDTSCVTDNDTASTMPTQVESQCEPLTIPLCQDLGYTSTMMPNMLGHNTQDDAGLEVNQFYPLVRLQCSPALKPFLCAIYAPNCSAESLPQMPCRSLCEMARDDCSSVISTFGFAWPEDFDCTFLPNENCYDAGLTMEVKNPDEAETVGSCEEISLPMCVNISYSQTRLPNVLGHTSQYEAMMALLDNAILIGSECSTAMIPFACSVYAPMCTADGSAKPCRNLCEQAMYECQQFLTILNMEWPEELKCSQFTNEDTRCVTDNDTASTMPTQVESQCEPLTIPLCQDLGYTSTMMPNMLGHNTQDAAGLEVNQFYPLVRVQCSPALQPFLCALYAPNCSAESLPQMPCRSLCEMARDDCSSVINTFGFAWPEDFDCTFLPNENCYDAGLTMEVKIPDEGETVGSCEEISLPMCVNISYSQTRLPNVLGHTSQYEAMMALLDNAILIGSECSIAMIPFACSVYAPMCTADGSAKPCRNLCEQAMYECQQFLTILNMEWPEELQCSQFTNEDPSCSVDSDKDMIAPPIGQHRCEPLKNPHCDGLSYNTTQLPNILGDVDQNNSVAAMAALSPLIASGCSSDLKVYACAIFSPPCSNGVPLLPCRSLCEAVENGCGSIFSSIGGQDAASILQCSVFPDQNCYDGDADDDVNPTVGSDEDIMYTNVGPIEGHNIGIGVESGSNCVQMKSRRYDVTALGLSDYFRGWVDVQGQGAANDYCRVVRSVDGNLELSCALAGSCGTSEFNYNIIALDGETFVPGRYGEWYVRDENGDGRDDYCRCVYRDLELYVSCIPAMAEGFVGNQEFRVEAEGCGVEQFDPFIGPRP